MGENWKGQPVRRSDLTAIRKALPAILVVLLTLASVLQAASEGWQRRDVDWQAGGGRRIKGIQYPKDRPVPLRSEEEGAAKHSTDQKVRLYSAPARTATALLANEMLVESPPVDGFVPWIAVSITTRRKAELELEADVETSVRGSYPAGANPRTDYVIGLFDTGASAHVMGYADGMRTGV